MSVYRVRASFVPGVIGYGIGAVTWRTKLDEEIPKSKLPFSFVIGFADGVARINHLVTNNHDVFPVVRWQEFLLMVEIIFKFLV